MFVLAHYQFILQRKDGLVLLREEMHIPYESENFQQEILIDCIYDAAIYAISKGMSWDEASCFVDTFKKILNESIGILPKQQIYDIIFNKNRNKYL